MFGEESHAARPGDIGTGLVVACPFVAVKAVLRAGIDVNFDVRPLGADGLDVGKRDACVFIAKVKLGRYFRPVIGEADDRATVVADRGGQAGQLGRCGIGDASAEAKTDDADRPTFFTASIAAWVSRNIAAQSGLAMNLRASVISSGE
jgi:hypothetical protein